MIADNKQFSSPARRKFVTSDKRSLTSSARRAWTSGVRTMRTWLLQYTFTLELAILLAAALAGAVLIFTFFFVPPAEQPEQNLSIVRDLATSTIDELEVWIEDRQTAYENPPVFPARVFPVPPNPSPLPRGTPSPPAAE